jgi:hypothetical protein
MSDRATWLVAVAALAAFGALAFAAALRWSRWRTSARSRRRARRGFAGQAAAAKLLSGAGYEVLDANPRIDWTAVQGGQAQIVELRGDYLVRRGGRHYIAEVKTGDAAEFLGNSATRRQILEYQLAFGVDGVLLVCPERRSVEPIEFPDLPSGAGAAGSSPLMWFLAGAAMGGAGALIAAHALG